MSAVSAFDSVMSKLGIKSSSTTDASKTTTGSNTLDPSSFLTLLTAQLQNQDPLDPVDNSQMVDQMAQMSTVSGISQMNSTLSSIASLLGGSSSADALGYVGKSVLVDGSTAYPNTDGSVTAQATLSSDASDLSVQISDSTGNVLRTLDLGKESAGTVAINWDGKTDSGATASGGPYTIKAFAANGTSTTAASTQVWAPVSSVSLGSDGSASTLNVLGIGSVPVSSVYQIG